GEPTQLGSLLAGAAAAPSFAAVIDVNDPSFLAPGDMTPRIAAACEATGQSLPRSQAATTRCILESLALAYRRTVRLAGELSGQPVDVVHVVGGGVRNELVQARTLGAALPDLASMRQLIRSTHQVRRYEPTGTQAAWDAAEERLDRAVVGQ
ncbi:MAG TPA: FGGY-family carbohydrate kinase, partial [Nocardioidaceae bacterium]|nr:FGGY-family carbohydrate kinase [Nocardioidaceae bacterium]